MVLQARDTDDRINPEGSAPILMNGPMFDLTVVKANDILKDGNSIGPQSSVTIDGHSGTEVKIKYPHIEHDYAKWNTLTYCTSFKILGSEEGRKEVVCPGPTRIMFPAHEYADRVSAINNKYNNFLWQSDSQGFGVIFSYYDHYKKVSSNLYRGYCA